MIVGTAGHIDHGKTALVRALTGTDTDRLPEEKRRGITIELGYAFMPTPDGGRIGFIDMPGHEKLVRTMVAGASGIDYVLLLVAGDDGIMPQTLEHLTILSLLGVRRGVAVITKIDRVDDALLSERRQQLRQLLDAAGLEEFAILNVSAMRGDGVEALRALLLREAQGPMEDTNSRSAFRMGMDRAFTLSGIGTVVAGSIASGEVRIGDMLCLGHASDRPYRVRSLQVHGESVESAHAGQRCAMGLAGLERSAVERGQMLCDPAIAQGSSRFDVCLRVADTETEALRSGTLVHLHVGTQERMATVAALGKASIAPGQTGLAQLVLQQALNVWQGDRFILRDASASRTLAGGTVLDTDGPTRYRQTAERLSYLESQRDRDPALRLQAALAHAPFGLSKSTWLRSAGFKDWPFDLGELRDVAFVREGEWMIARAHLADNENEVIRALGEFHTRYPDDIGPDMQRARRLAAPRMSVELWEHLIAHMVENGRIARRRGFVYLNEHGVQLLDAERVVGERALPLLLEGHFDPPWVRDIATMTGLAEIQVRHVLARMATAGDTFQIVKDLYYHPKAVRELASIARHIEARDGKVSAMAFRDATELGRKRAIQILEFFDRIGFLRRVGDAHLLRAGTALFPDESNA
ncbi:selenocysteine-specific translation elongation factor [Uliginosibacterium sp. sgz301328]|uniref:selenocysteine-specific translation elongation factor n=1 Tax=Uliginosibacterium sp. sgz301328 TaxID=3243764 RepID=UPI00359E3777